MYSKPKFIDPLQSFPKFACLTWIGCINILQRCNSTKVQRRNIAQRSMLDESCLLRQIHVQNFGSCCTSCQMWYANTMKVMSSYFRNYRSICQDMKRQSVISYVPPYTSILLRMVTWNVHCVIDLCRWWVITPHFQYHSTCNGY